MKEALLDPMVWAFVFYGLVANIPNGGITNFFSQLIVSFGYTPEESLLYGTPGGAIEIVALLACGYLGDRLGNRLLISILGLLWAIAGIVMIVAIPLSHPVPRLIGYYFTQVSAIGRSKKRHIINSRSIGRSHALCSPFVADIN